MASDSKNVAVSGLAGAITSLIVSAADGYLTIPASIKPVVTIGAGIIGSIITFEVISWFVVFRLKRLKSSLDQMIPTFETFRDGLQTSITRQVDAMKQNNATQKALKDIEDQLNTSSRRVVDALIEIDRKGLEILRDIAS
jgi:hypothetical protein